MMIIIFHFDFTNSLILLLRNDIWHKKVTKIVFNVGQTIYLNFSALEKILSDNVVVCSHFEFFYFVLLSVYVNIHFSSAIDQAMT